MTSSDLSPVTASGVNVEASICAGRPVVWINSETHVEREALLAGDFTPDDVVKAQHLWLAAQPLLKRLFGHETIGPEGMVSPLIDVTDKLSGHIRQGIRLLVKADHALPITGTVKARGATFELIRYAETIARNHGVALPDGLASLAKSDCRALFAERTVIVGSTGNLGFCVGKVARALGFHAEIHMSRDAKAWKKERLRQLGARVVEHEGDYGVAVSAARQTAMADPTLYFVDDENSRSLFEGYSAAALELAAQLENAKIAVSSTQPLVVYLPCGVGGAPGGITYGLKSIFGVNAICVWVEPVESPAMLVQLTAPGSVERTVYDCGRSNATEADGLAVAQASPLVARNLRHLVDAIVTVTDDALLCATADLWGETGQRVEPSAAAGLAALSQFRAALPTLPGATHVIWTTGGSQLPDVEFFSTLEKASALCRTQAIR